LSARVSVIIVNWNGRQFLAPCIASLQAQTYHDFDIVLVDNGSVDGSTALVREEFPFVTLIENKYNVGFATANNQAIRATEAEFVATLNNDTQVEPGWLEALVSAMDQAPDVGMCASKMIFAAKPGLINSAGICLDRAAIAWDRLGGEQDTGANGQPSHVFGASAGAALYRRRMLDQIGLFDEAFFAYLEDVDLAWRAQLAGWRALYVPGARLAHAHSATAIEGSPFKRRLLGRNKVWMVIKNYPMPALLRYLPAILAYDGMALLYALFAYRDLHSLIGRLEAMASLRRVFRERKRIQRLSKSTASVDALQPLEPPWRVWRRFSHLSPAAEQVSD
jgi:GT2 family glycosyltransferase